MKAYVQKAYPEETECQAEMRERGMKLTIQGEIARKSCKNEIERERCMDAYGELHRALEDEIRQKYGLPALKWKRTNTRET